VLVLRPNRLCGSGGSIHRHQPAADVSPDTFARSVLTAGHCAYDTGFITAATFYPGRARTAASSASVDPYLGWEVTYVSTFNGWTSKKLFTFDVAVMTLGGVKPGTYTGWMGITPVASLNKATLLTAGYPGMMPRGTLWRTSCLVTDTNTADQLIKTQLCDFTEGNSGGPAWTVDAGVPKVKGVVSYQSCVGGKCGSKCCKEAGSYNAFVQMGTAITPSIIRWVTER
jgi:V8-like Glu-specific endopeptidase